MATLEFAFLQDLYPTETGKAVQALTSQTPLLGLVWRILITQSDHAEFLTSPIRELITVGKKGRVNADFFSDLPEHRSEAALAIAETQCDGLWWDDIARAIKNTYPRDERIDAALWCFSDMIIIRGEARPEAPKTRRNSYDYDDGFGDIVARLGHHSLPPLVLLSAPIKSNHAAMSTLDALGHARDLLWARGMGESGAMPELPSAQAILEAEAVNL